MPNNPDEYDMLSSYESVPFTVTPESLTFTVTTGLLRVDAEHLIMEFRSQDALFGLGRSGLSEIRIPFDDVLGLTWVSRMLGFENAIELRVRRQELLEGLPVSTAGVIELEIERKNRRSAESFCVDVGSAISRYRTDLRIEEVDREMASTGESPLDEHLLALELLVDFLTSDKRTDAGDHGRKARENDARLAVVRHVTLLDTHRKDLTTEQRLRFELATARLSSQPQPG